MVNLHRRRPYKAKDRDDLTRSFLDLHITKDQNSLHMF